MPLFAISDQTEAALKVSVLSLLDNDDWESTQTSALNKLQLWVTTMYLLNTIQIHLANVLILSKKPISMIIQLECAMNVLYG